MLWFGFFFKKNPKTKQLKGSFRLKTADARQVLNPNIGV